MDLSGPLLANLQIRALPVGYDDPMCAHYPCYLDHLDLSEYSLKMWDHFSTSKRSTRKEHDAGCFLAVVDILQRDIKECDYSTNIGIQYLYVRWACCNIWESLPFRAESVRF